MYYKVCTISEVNYEMSSPPLCPSLSNFKTSRELQPHCLYSVRCSLGLAFYLSVLVYTFLAGLSQHSFNVSILHNIFFSFAYFCSPGSGEIEFKACIVTLKSNTKLSLCANISNIIEFWIHRHARQNSFPGMLTF